MRVLGIETTCDETAAAVVVSGREILSNVIASQIDRHRPFGGVVPELASREHVQCISEVIESALAEAGVTMQQIDRIAVAKGPGLIGALLVGIQAAIGLGIALKKPVVGVNHVEAHLYAALMGRQDEALFPALGAVLSGGHTSLLHIEEAGCYKLISQTTDDAVGEAYDKVAALLALSYPGGPAIERLAKQGDPKRYTLRAGQVKGQPLAFSFSGLKTSVLYAAKGVGSDKNSPLRLSEQERADLAAAFQETALSDVVKKISLAAKEYGSRSLVIGGGVSNNRRLRELVEALGLPVFWPPPGLSLDNAAMIAGLGCEKEPSGLDIQAEPRLRPFWN